MENNAITIWREFIKLSAGDTDFTTFDDWYRHIEHIPERYVPGLVAFEVNGKPANWIDVGDALEDMIKNFPFERGKKYTIKIVPRE